MKCKNCGEELDEGMAFCTKCGTKVEKEEPKNDIEETKEEVAVETKIPEQEIEKDTKEASNENKTDDNKEKAQDQKETTTESKPKKKKSKLGIIIFIIIILIAIAGGAVYLFREELGLVESDDKEDKDKETSNSVVISEEENQIEEKEEVDKTLITTDKQNFKNGLAWCKVDGQLICIDTEGKVVFRVPEEFTYATDFDNSEYALLSNGENKAIVDKTGNIIVTDKDNSAFDTIISNDVIAGCVVVCKNIDTYEKNENQYGIIGFEGNWILELSADNDFLLSFKTGLTDKIMYNGSEIYFVDSAKQIKTNTGDIEKLVSEDDTYVYLYTTYVGGSKTLLKVKKDGSKQVEVILADIESIGNYSNGLIYINVEKDGKEKKGFYDLTGKLQTEITEENVVTVTEITEDGYYGILTRNNAGNQYLFIVDSEGNQVFEPIKGAEEIKYLGENRFFISYSNEDEEVSYVSDEKGEKIYSTDNITEYENGYAVKDKENYVDVAGMILTIIEE